MSVLRLPRGRFLVRPGTVSHYFPVLDSFSSPPSLPSSFLYAVRPGRSDLEVDHFRKVAPMDTFDPFAHVQAIFFPSKTATQRPCPRCEPYPKTPTNFKEFVCLIEIQLRPDFTNESQNLKEIIDSGATVSKQSPFVSKKMEGAHLLH